jgi:hypothetical protein
MVNSTELPVMVPPSATEEVMVGMEGDSGLDIPKELKDSKDVDDTVLSMEPLVLE